MACAATGKADAIRAMIVAGSFVNSQDELGNTALMIAALKGHATSVSMLLAHRADVNMPRKVRIPEQ